MNTIFSILEPVKAINFSITTPLPPHLTIWDVVSGALNVLLPLASVVLTIFIVYGGITYMTSAGDPGKVKSAQQIITNSIIGFVIITLSFVIRAIVNKAIGVNF